MTQLTMSDPRVLEVIGQQLEKKKEERAQRDPVVLSFEDLEAFRKLLEEAPTDVYIY